VTAYKTHADDAAGGPGGGPNAVGSTGVYWVLGTPNAPDSGDYQNDHAVHDLSLSLGEQAAVVELVYGRVELASRQSGTGGAYYRGNARPRNLPGLSTASVTFHEVLGRHFVSGEGPLQLHFDEPIEALSNAEGSTDNAFAVWVKRIDSESAVAYHLNVEYEVRY
jgi:hypothetical protein